MAVSLCFWDMLEWIQAAFNLDGIPESFTNVTTSELETSKLSRIKLKAHEEDVPDRPSETPEATLPAWCTLTSERTDTQEADSTETSPYQWTTPPVWTDLNKRQSDLTLGMSVSKQKKSFD